MNPNHDEQRLADRQYLRQGRVLAGPDVDMPLVQKGHQLAFQARALEGSGYIAREGEAFVRRVQPKLGKVARKAEKRRRRYDESRRRIL